MHTPLLPFFDIFSGTHVRLCVQVAMPLGGWQALRPSHINPMKFLTYQTIIKSYA